MLFELGCLCKGETVIRNAGRLRLKESDRIAAMCAELEKMGGKLRVEGDTVTITGTALHAPTEPLDGHNDHRIVMALAVAAYAAEVPAVIEGAQAVRKSWPNFFEVLRSLGAAVQLQEEE